MSRKKKTRAVRRSLRPKPPALPKSWTDGPRCPTCIREVGEAMAGPRALIDGQCRQHYLAALT